MRLIILLSFVVALSAAFGCAGRVRSPAPPPVSAEQGYRFLQEGKKEQALQVFQALLRANPRDRQARVEVGYLYAALARWEEAVRALDAAAEEDPANMRLRMDLAYARQALGEYDAAANDFHYVLRQPGEFEQQAREALKAIETGAVDAAHQARQAGLIDAGYDALRRGQGEAARKKFELALTEDPRATEVQKQLGYMNLQQGQIAQAADQFEGAHHLDPTDYASALQLGYIYDQLHNPRKAEEAFRRAALSPDPEIREAAKNALKNVRTPSLYLDLYANPFYTSRFADRIADASVQLGWKPVKHWPVSFYMGGRFTQDSKSHSGSQPQVYSDNVALAGGGVRLQPDGMDASLSAEINEAFNRTLSPEHPNARETDRRVVLTDYHYWAEPYRLFTDLSGSLGYYSRYRDNVIGLGELRQGIRVWKSGPTLIDLYAPLNLVKDVNKDFFNNLVEFGAGIEIQPWIEWNLKARAEYLHGVYFGIEGRDRNPYGAHYDDFRLVMIFSKRFALSSGDDFFVAGPKPSGSAKVDWGGFSP